MYVFFNLFLEREFQRQENKTYSCYCVSWRKNPWKKSRVSQRLCPFRRLINRKPHKGQLFHFLTVAGWPGRLYYDECLVLSNKYCITNSVWNNIFIALQFGQKLSCALFSRLKYWSIICTKEKVAISRKIVQGFEKARCSTISKNHTTYISYKLEF